jgi:hypothetical protein
MKTHSIIEFESQIGNQYILPISFEAPTFDSAHEQYVDLIDGLGSNGYKVQTGTDGPLRDGLRQWLPSFAKHYIYRMGVALGHKQNKLIMVEEWNRGPDGHLYTEDELLRFPQLQTNTRTLIKGFYRVGISRDQDGAEQEYLWVNVPGRR